jgi:peptide/nickel transport system substrate-binding protein
MNPDGKTWTFQLRKNVVFHDGTPWNSEAASINLKWLAKGTGKNTLSAVESIETLINIPWLSS